MPTLKPRTLGRVIRRAMRTFPAVVITGPRQSGKTTLLQLLCGRTHRFVSLEDPDVRLRAREDPRAFLDTYGPPVILDEIQYVPELFPYLKTAIDARRTPGQWILSGSQSFPLMARVSESLAGRAAVLSLLPFSYAERINRGNRSADVPTWLRRIERRLPTGGTKQTSLPELILRGCYPDIASRQSVDRQLWCGSYLATYLERDVRALAAVGDLGEFERFLRLCATRTGQLLNLSDMARAIGVSVPTAKRWLSVLEASAQVLLLAPYYRNIGKRTVKRPKLYVTDTALATYLLGIHDRDALLASPHLGALIETLVVTDCWKRFLHNGTLPSLWYLRTRDDLEIDLVIESGERLHLFEIKTTMAVTPAHAVSLIRLRREARFPVGHTAVISRTLERVPLGHGVINIPWREFLTP